MGFFQELIVALVTVIVQSIAISREAAAAKLEEIAAKIRSGALVPEAAFEQAQDDVERFEAFAHLNEEND